MSKLISKPDFNSTQCFTDYGGRIVQVYESFATTGFRVSAERDHNIRQRIDATSCMLCGENFKSAHEENYKSGDIGVHEKVRACRGCGNWIGVFSSRLSLSAPEVSGSEAHE